MLSLGKSRATSTTAIFNGGVRCKLVALVFKIRLVMVDTANWSGLTFRCAAFSSPPIPATANSQALAVMPLDNKSYLKSLQ